MAVGAAAFVPLRRCPALLRGRQGVTTAAFAMLLTATLGAVGLATEAAMWYSDWVAVQGAADSAAMAGAVSISVPSEQSNGGPVATMTYVATQNGFTNGTSGTTVTTHYPPADGSYSGNTYAAEIVISKQETLHFAGLFLKAGPTVTGRAVGLYKSNSPACVMALGNDTSTSNNGQLYMTGGAALSASGCTIAGNNTGAHSVELDPSAQVTAYTIQSAGTIASTCGQGIYGCGNVINVTRPPSSNSVASTDPLASVQNVSLPPSSDFPTSCTQSIGSTTTAMTPNTAATAYCAINVGGRKQTTQLSATGGTYYINGGINICTSGCNVTGTTALQISSTTSGSTFYINGSITINGASNAILDVAPGTYFIYNGSLVVGNSGGITCSTCSAGGGGATFVLMGNTPGIVSLTGDSPVSFSAPASSNYNSALDGVAIYEPVNDTGLNVFGGSAAMTLQGAVYAPGAALSISGTSALGSTTCSWFIANTISMTGSGTASDANCSAYGYTWGSSKGTLALVE